jgi:hypothetical protein
MADQGVLVYQWSTWKWWPSWSTSSVGMRLMKTSDRETTEGSKDDWMGSELGWDER